MQMFPTYRRFAVGLGVLWRVHFDRRNPQLLMAVVKEVRLSKMAKCMNRGAGVRNKDNLVCFYAARQSRIKYP